MKKTEIHGNVGELIQAESATIQVFIDLSKGSNRKKPRRLVARKQKQLAAKVFVVSFLFVLYGGFMGFIAPEYFGVLANFAVFIAMLLGIASSLIIFKKT